MRGLNLSAESCPGGLPQGLGGVGDHWGGSCGSGDLNAPLPAGDRASVEGNGFWR